MDLKEFVKETLVQISKGIEEANEELKDSAAIVNPLNITGHTENAQTYARTRGPSTQAPESRVVQPVKFDVAVVTESGVTGSAGAKLSIASIGIGAEGKKESSNSSESRISFVIPMVYPGHSNKS